MNKRICDSFSTILPSTALTEGMYGKATGLNTIFTPSMAEGDDYLQRTATGGTNPKPPSSRPVTISVLCWGLWRFIRQKPSIVSHISQQTANFFIRATDMTQLFLSIISARPAMALSPMFPRPLIRFLRPPKNVERKRKMFKCEKVIIPEPCAKERCYRRHACLSDGPVCSLLRHICKWKTGRL